MDLNNPYAPSAAAVGAVGANPANPAAAPTAAASSHHHPLAVGGAGLSYQAHPNAQPSAAFLGGAAKPSASMAAAAYAGAGAAPYAVAKSASFASTANLSSYSSDEDEEAMMPWERDNWVPTNKSGKQKTPNMIRGELQRYIDKCKAEGSATQTSILETMGVNNNSFRRFMDPSTYKGKWSGCQNGTYWAAAKLLARVAHEQEQAKKSAKKGKRKSAEGTSSAKRAKTDAAGGGGGSAAAAAAAPRKKTAAEAKAEASRLIERIKAVEGVPEGAVYDTCSQLVAKIKSFLERDGVTKAALLSALGDINSNSLTRFLAGKKQDQCGSVVYRSSYVFFEKLRILEGAPKSAARKKNEAENPDGFSLKKARAGTWKILPVQPGERFSW